MCVCRIAGGNVRHCRNSARRFYTLSDNWTINGQKKAAGGNQFDHMTTSFLAIYIICMRACMYIYICRYVCMCVCFPKLAWNFLSTFYCLSVLVNHSFCFHFQFISLSLGNSQQSIIDSASKFQNLELALGGLVTLGRDTVARCHFCHKPVCEPVNVKPVGRQELRAGPASSKAHTV